jgi:hypothetical protein
MSRVGYVAQVGLDFGTAFCKCIVRDIGRGKARVLQKPNSVGTAPFLFSSVINFESGRFLLGESEETRGLPFAKMLLTEYARGKIDGATKLLWREYIEKLPSTMMEIDGVLIAIGWRLAPILREARTLARRMMPGFGDHRDDHLFVNLCVPVDHMQDRAVVAAFQKALFIAWKLSRCLDLPETMTAADLRNLIENTSDGGASGLCELYPEVAANVQAFLKSGFADGNWGIPFLMTDVGSGTVDQSFFILSSDLKQLTFLAALVRPLGSAEIERRCAEEFASKPCYSAVLAEVRAHKEGNSLLTDLMRPRFHAVVDNLCKEIEQMTYECAQNGSWTSEREEKLRFSQFTQTILMNSGGGMRDDPYRIGVRSAFHKYWSIFPETIELPRPNDLVTSDGRALPPGWFRRLAVAYGLSYPIAELHRITLPDAVRPLRDGGERNREPIYQAGRCRDCGRPAIPGDDLCYNCSS